MKYKCRSLEVSDVERRIVTKTCTSRAFNNTETEEKSPQKIRTLENKQGILNNVGR